MRVARRSNSIWSSEENLLEYYSIQCEDFRMRHTAIWTEVQHYTWVLSILLSAFPYAVYSDSWSENGDYRYLIAVFPALGCIIACIAFFIIRNDFIYYTDADNRMKFLERELGVLLKPDYLDRRLKKVGVPAFNVHIESNAQASLIRNIWPIRIRVLILFTFVAYLIGALAEMWILFYPPISQKLDELKLNANTCASSSLMQESQSLDGLKANEPINSKTIKSRQGESAFPSVSPASNTSKNQSNE